VCVCVCVSVCVCVCVCEYVCIMCANAFAHVYLYVCARYICVSACLHVIVCVLHLYVTTSRAPLPQGGDRAKNWQAILARCLTASWLDCWHLVKEGSN
jgi:hypothetical protein